MIIGVDIQWQPSVLQPANKQSFLCCYCTRGKRVSAMLLLKEERDNSNISSYRSWMVRILRPKSTRYYVSRVIYEKYSFALKLSLAFHSLLGSRYSPVPELSFLPAPYRGSTRAGEKRVQDNLHAHAQNEPIKNY